MINNAQRAQELAKREGSLAAYFWQYEPISGARAHPQPASATLVLVALSKDMKRLGRTFVGPTTVYAFMQAMGLVNDHAKNYVVRVKTEHAR